MCMPAQIQLKTVKTVEIEPESAVPGRLGPGVDQRLDQPEHRTVTATDRQHAGQNENWRHGTQDEVTVRGVAV